MRESCTSGSVRGASSDRCLYSTLLADHSKPAMIAYERRPLTNYQGATSRVMLPSDRKQGLHTAPAFGGPALGRRGLSPGERFLKDAVHRDTVRDRLM